MLLAGYQRICKVRTWHTMAGSPTLSKQPLPAKALIDFLAAPAATAPVYQAKGMEPG